MINAADARQPEVPAAAEEAASAARRAYREATAETLRYAVAEGTAEKLARFIGGEKAVMADLIADGEFDRLLARASHAGNLEACHLLLAAGASPYARDARGRPAADFAAEFVDEAGIDPPEADRLEAERVFAAYGLDRGGDRPRSRILEMRLDPAFAAAPPGGWMASLHGLLAAAGFAFRPTAEGWEVSGGGAVWAAALWLTEVETRELRAALSPLRGNHGVAGVEVRGA